VLIQFYFCPVDDWQIKDAEGRAKRIAEQDARRRHNIERLESHVGAIHRGEHGCLEHFARVWFGLFVDLDHSAQPFERLVSETNGRIAAALRDGFVALLHRLDLMPSPREIAELCLQGHRRTISEAALAGLDIVAARSQKEFLTLPEATLASGFCLNLAVPTDGERRWPGWIRAQRPDLAGAALLEFLRPLLEAKVEHVPGIHGLHEAGTFLAAPAVVLTLLREFPDAEVGTLEVLISAALGQCDQGAVERLANEALRSSENNLSYGARLRWTAVAFLFASERYAASLSELTDQSADAAKQLFVFLKSCWSAVARSNRLDHGLLQPLIAILAGRFSNADARRGGRVGEAEPEDIARFIRQLIDRLSNDATKSASEALQRLRSDPRLASWLDYLRHAAAVQMRNRREASFRYADVGKVVATLANRAPANAADLQALVADHLRDLAKQIRDGATDAWKSFWNTDSHGNATRPRVENECRDRLLDLLRDKLARHNVAADREASFAGHTRADIKVTAGIMAMPVEIKRHYHRELWTAPQEQLRDLYSRDPATDARGIYLVFWFGEEKGRALPRPPSGIARPRSADELRERLVEAMPTEDRRRIEVSVIDCAKAHSR